ncbi:hypothetical protein N7478_004632 [Penicillium angulare]|uniref:uncharacterized protein n=1 Tax=Penicillium angulare TaxID=116970 RepID=UPI002541342F|nr:uncharacterized protein N7478_004632 [Penicillium angulare]KAJ5279260.1 hypothetical protein N7478_004632 [Penicillium angulare]
MYSVAFGLLCTQAAVGQTGSSLGKLYSIQGTKAFLSTTSQMAQPRNAQAPWRDTLASHLKQTPGYEFSIATVTYDSNGQAVPRVRTCGCRGFFPELELHPSGQKDMENQVANDGNPLVFESDMLTFTTDSRMEKLPQLYSSGHAIEAMFWLKDKMVQWRIKGRAFSIGDCFGVEDNEGEKASRGQIKDYLRTKGGFEGDVNTWSWEKAVTKYFANHSPIMRGSFRSPPPGQPRSQLPSDDALRLGQKVTDLYDPVARANFRVVIIIPDEVEQLDLSNQEDIKREKWTYLESARDQYSGHWEHTELWP